MNYSTIESAREELSKYENDYQELVKKINLSLFSLARTSLSSDEKKRVWKGLSDYTRNIIASAEKRLDELSSIRFSESENVLQEEKLDLAQRYNNLIVDLQKEKETILRQMSKEISPLTSLRQKDPKSGYCYFDDISITGDFRYRLAREEQEVLGVEVPEGAEFCSQECLMGYCKEFKNREKVRQGEEKKNREKIENDKRAVTEIQMSVANLMKRLNELERKKTQLELSEGDSREENKNTGFFRRLGLKLGLVKDNSFRSVLERTKKMKAALEMELDKKNNELQKALIALSVDEQVEKERQKLRLFQQKTERISAKAKKGDDSE